MRDAKLAQGLRDVVPAAPIQVGPVQDPKVASAICDWAVALDVLRHVRTGQVLITLGLILLL